MKRKQGKSSRQRPAKSAARTKEIVAAPHELKQWWAVFALALLTLMLSAPVFAPLSFWPSAHIMFAPWLVAVVLTPRRRRAYLVSYLLGAAFFLFHFRWMMNTTIAGYLAGCFLGLGLYFPLTAWLVRHLHRRRGVPMMVSFPVVWVALEWVRSIGPLAFPWFLTGHTQIRLLSLVQIADVGGVFLISFLVCAVNGWVADRIVLWKRHRVDPTTATPRFIPIGATVIVALLAASFAYGRYRLNTREVTPGPRIAVLQADFVLHATDLGETTQKKRAKYLALLDKAASAEPKPDLVVFPETPWPQYLNQESRETREGYHQFQGMKAVATNHHRMMRSLVDKHGLPLVIGGFAAEPLPVGSHYERNLHNSAFFYRPEIEEPQRYDKIHLVPFGEYVPFRESSALQWLHRLLNDGPYNPWGVPRKQEGQFMVPDWKWQWPWSSSPWLPWGPGGNDYSMTHGQESSIFALPAKSLDGKAVNFGITICYEDVTPSVFRQFIIDEQGAKQAAFMLNISNDGWFGHGTQQAQHLVNCAFRAIENRVPVARAVNTGISGFVESDGTWHDIVTGEPGKLKAGGEGVSISQVSIDPRVTVYSRMGDLFAVICFIWAVGVLVDAMLLRFFMAKVR